MKSLLYLALFGLVLFTLTACDDDDPEPENPEELITTLQLVFTPEGGGDPILQTFRDIDGDGGMDPTITTFPLDANTSYDLTLNVLDESKTPPEDIGEEIEEEDDEHQFFFEVSGLNLQIEYADSDGDGNPLGLVNTAATGDASTGSLKVTLRHEPAKEADGVSDGDITNAGGETDIEVTFQFPII